MLAEPSSLSLLSATPLLLTTCRDPFSSHYGTLFACHSLLCCDFYVFKIVTTSQSACRRQQACRRYHHSSFTRNAMLVPRPEVNQHNIAQQPYFPVLPRHGQRCWRPTRGHGSGDHWIWCRGCQIRNYPKRSHAFTQGSRCRPESSSESQTE